MLALLSATLSLMVSAQSWVNTAVSRVQAGDAANASSGVPKISPSD